MNSQQRRQQAKQLFQRGQLTEAEAIYSQLCNTSPADIDAWLMRGACYGQLNQYPQAEECFRKAIKLQPRLFNGWDNLGIALMYQKQYKEAEKCFRQANKIQPNYAPAYNNLGNLMREQSRLDEAIRLFNKALHHQANYPAAHNNLAITLHEKRDQDGAEFHARKAIQQNPNYPVAYHNLGDILISRHQEEEAYQCYQQALKLKPDLVETCQSIGILLESRKRYDLAQEYFHKAIQIQPDFVKAHIQLVRRMIQKNQFNDAMNYLLDIYNKHPDNIEISAEIANLLILQGDTQQAYKRILPILEQNHPFIILAYARISSKINQQADALQRLLKLAQKKGLAAGLLNEVYFEIGNLYHKNNEYHEAFRYYKKANELIPYQSDLEQHLQKIEQIKDFFTPQQINALASSRLDSKRPLFIIGMPRSGTTLVEQILSSHPQVYGAGEILDIWRIANTIPIDTGKTYPHCLKGLKQTQVDHYAQQYLNALQEYSDDALLVSDKLPHNFIHLGMIAMLFPNAKIIHCQRDAMDNCLSIYFHKFNQQHFYARKLGELGQYYQAYEKLMQHWHRNLPISILDLRYEDMVKDQEGYSRKLIEFCGLEWDNNCLNFHQSERIANTPSNEQVRQPIYKTSIQRWKHYEEYLGELKKALDYD